MEAVAGRRVHLTLPLESEPDPDAESIPMVDLSPTRAVVRQAVNDHRAPWRHRLPVAREGSPTGKGTT